MGEQGRPGPRELVEALGYIDRSAASMCGCACAREVLHMLPGADVEWGRRILGLAEEVVTGRSKTSPDTVTFDGRRLLHTYQFADLRSDQRIALEAIASASALTDHGSAYFAFNQAALALEFDFFAGLREITMDRTTGRRIPSATIIAYLGRVIGALRWPLHPPATPGQLSIATAEVSVAWDAVSECVRTDHTMVELYEAHERAKRLGLGWGGVGRAIAERATDEARVYRLLHPDRCSGVGATWCPYCGDCTCPVDEYGDRYSMDEPDCPLHGLNSKHGDD